MASVTNCSLRKCIQGALESEMARVEVKSFELPEEERESMEVLWSEDGQAMFHDVCWKALIDSFKQDNPFALSPREKDLVKESWKTAEYFDSQARLRAEASRISCMLKNAKYAIAFTGAGISTKAGIGDFRGKLGKWTERDREKIYGPSKFKRSPAVVVLEEIRPTYTHEALCKLLELGYLKHIISQNTDGIHRLSGVPRDKISELHGNSFHEKCEKCAARYERNSAVLRTDESVPPKLCQHCHIDHRTGRVCERKGCDGHLMNTIINFGDGLEHHVLSTAEEHAQKSDMVLCLGSSLRVTPACDLVEMGQKPIRLVLNNRQPTPFDKLCYQTVEPDKGPLGSRLYGDCDLLVKLLMESILDEEELSAWEDDRESREEEYNKARRQQPYQQQEESPTTEEE